MRWSSMDNRRKHDRIVRGGLRMFVTFQDEQAEPQPILRCGYRIDSIGTHDKRSERVGEKVGNPAFNMPGNHDSSFLGSAANMPNQATGNAPESTASLTPGHYLDGG
jgi:hypothetical protein